MKMTKAEARDAFPTLFAKWRRSAGNASHHEQTLLFDEFCSWLRDNHPEALGFRSVMGAEFALEQWFDEATHQSWRR